MEPLWAGQSGFLPLRYSNSTGTETHYGFLQISMQAPPPGPAPLVEPPMIFVEYWAWEPTPNAPATTTLLPEPTAMLALLAVPAMLLRRRRSA
jgi:hypothetical protein